MQNMGAHMSVIGKEEWSSGWSTLELFSPFIGMICAWPCARQTGWDPENTYVPKSHCGI